MAVMEQLFIDIRKDASFHCIGMGFHFSLPDMRQAAPCRKAAPFNHWPSSSTMLANPFQGIDFPCMKPGRKGIRRTDASGFLRRPIL
jgi:hypothetical protein